MSQLEQVSWGEPAGTSAGELVTRGWGGEWAQLREGGQPAISPCALVPQRLIQPFVPQVRLVSRRRFGNAAADRARAREGETDG